MEGIKDLLKDIMEQIANQKQDLNNIKEEITKTINENINDNFLRFMQKNRELEEKINKNQQSITYIEKYIKRRNLIFYGVEENENNYLELERMILEIINKDMKVNFERNCIEYVGRLGKNNINNKLRPVLVTLSTVGNKIELLKKKRSLKDTKYYIQEDYTKEIVQKRRELVKNLFEERKNGKNCILKYDKIIYLEKDNPDEKKHRKNNIKTFKRNLSISPETSKNKVDLKSTKKSKIYNIKNYTTQISQPSTSYENNNQPKNHGQK